MTVALDGVRDVPFVYAVGMDHYLSKGRVALVTGASKGLGLSLARLLAERGLSLVIDARGAQALDATRDELSSRTQVAALCGDVADAEHVHALVALAKERFGRIDVLINNASTIGRSPMPALAQLSPVVFERLVTTNVWAPLHLVQHALPLMARGSTIVNVSSDAALNAYPGWGGYGASKAALEHLSRTLAVELEPAGISLVLADPGNMNTALHREAEPGEDLSALPDAAAVAPALAAWLEAKRPAFVRVELQGDAVAVAGA
jgi:NAD(P)-dependent dehydrogenase (short-subunit alcohol dehydrogenase family)